MEKLKMKNLKLNYHLTEVCNFGCKFCFAKYKHRCRLSFDEMETIVKKTADCGFFSGINFAGGEPFLVKRLPELIKIAKDKQLETSVITNGSFLTTEMLDSILPFLDCIGISVHSVSDKIKIKTGSCSKTNEVLSNERLLEICRYIRRKSNCKIKINTVVNSLNKTEIISDFIATHQKEETDQKSENPVKTNAKAAVTGMFFVNIPDGSEEKVLGITVLPKLS